jgi:hypothetical protein
MATDTTSGGVTPPSGWTLQSSISATGSSVEVFRRDGDRKRPSVHVHAKHGASRDDHHVHYCAVRGW